MMLFFAYFVSTLLTLLNAAPSSYQHVSFFRNGNQKSHSSSFRTSRNAYFNTDDLLIWDDDYQYEHNPYENTFKFETSGDHITPDYSNGLAYPDPYLKTGPEASRAAWYLYKNPLFFKDIKHVDSIYQNQELRKRNGLSGNRLGSLRPKWPTYRYKKQYYRNNYQYNYNSDDFI